MSNISREIHLSPMVRGHLAMICVTLIFGMNGPLSKGLLMSGALTPYAHMFSRFFGATVLFWLASLFMPKERIDRADWLPLIGASLTGVLFNQGLFAIGISMTSPVNQSLISTLGPVVTMFLAAIFLKEPITRLKALGVTIGAAGVILLVSTNMSSRAGSSLGDLICATATISYSLYLTLFKRIIMKYHPITLMKWMFVFSLVFVAPKGVADMVAVDWSTWDGGEFASLLFVVLGATFTAYLVLPFAQKLLRPTVVSIYNYGNPVIASVMATILGQDQLTPMKFLSGVLILFGVFMVTRSKSRAQLVRERARQN